jgi:hypothetical protein
MAGLARDADSFRMLVDSSASVAVPAPARPWGRPTALWALAITALLAETALALVDVGRPGPELTAMKVLYNALIVGSALAVLARAYSRPGQRLGWALVGSGVAAWAAGDLYFWLVPQPGGDASFPSFSDVMFLGFYAATLPGVLFLRRSQRPGTAISLDLLVMVSAAATAWSSIVFAPVSRTVHEFSAAAAATLAYPALDMVVVLMALSIFVRANWRPGLAWGMLAFGFLVCAGADLLYTLEVVHGSYSPGTLPDCLWPASTLMIAGAAWAPSSKVDAPATPSESSFALALGLTLCALAVLVADHFRRIDVLTVVLATATVLLGVARGALAYSMRAEAERAARDAATGTIKALAAAVDAKDAYTRWHSDRVARYATAIGSRLGMPADHVDRLTTAGHLHDVGKIAVSDAVLLKPGRLTDEEFDEVKRHSAEGERIVAATGLIDMSVWIRHHHERWDGSGYPDGIAGDQIPLESRILAAADALDAMTTTRTYSAAKSVDEAIQQIAANAGTQFDPRVAACLIELLSSRVLQVEVPELPSARIPKGPALHTMAA